MKNVMLFILFVLFTLSTTACAAQNPTPGTKWKGNNKVMYRLHTNKQCKRIGVQKIKPFKFSKRYLKNNAKSIKQRGPRTCMPKFRSN